ncbi:serpin family protein [Streptomyces sp. NPDC004787]|uniref:serpin family protein n=1 Tax=Streptomyces sp. NPDC004787 TaxID=3154291 RepID=UPI0033A1D34C
MRGATVRAVNGLAARWAAALPTPAPSPAPAPAPGIPADAAPGTVFSACGVWPLLALLADGAAGPAREELADALGVPAPAAETARELLAALARIPGAGAAIGLWVRPEVALREAWATGLPGGSLGRLGAGGSGADDSRKLLDAWAAEHTDGLVRELPVTVDEDTLLVLAAAQAVRTTWLRPFWESVTTPERGPWAGRRLVALRRSTALLDRVGVAGTAAGPLTVLRVLGDTGVDVHLLLGTEEASAGAVLRGGLDVLAGAVTAVPGDVLPLGEPGPGLRVAQESSVTSDPRLRVCTPPFSLAAEHDLLDLHGVFGLTTARDASRGHFPGIADRPPLAVQQARQAAAARFGARGFEAASVAAVSTRAGAGRPLLTYRVRAVDLALDRPFGFLAVHRSSRLVLSAGWVAEPTPLGREGTEKGAAARAAAPSSLGGSVLSGRQNCSAQESIRPVS